jgi:high-affinity nickel-transport protein
MTGISGFVIVSIPAMIILGIRHALDVDHITAIDNLVRLHNAQKKSRWVGTGFSSGHMLSVLAEMVFIIYLVGGIGEATDNFALWGGLTGAAALSVIGGVNVYSMKRWNRTGSAILASKVLFKIRIIGPVGGSIITGVVFGLGFDTATQISAITVSAVASAAAGVQIALVLAGFFALGMIPVDTLDSLLLRSAFHQIFAKNGFRYFSYALSGAALAIAAMESYSTLTGSNVIPSWIGMVLAGGIITASFGYGVISRNKDNGATVHEHRHMHKDGLNHIHPHIHTKDEKAHEHQHRYEENINAKEKDTSRENS